MRVRCGNLHLWYENPLRLDWDGYTIETVQYGNGEMNRTDRMLLVSVTLDGQEGFGVELAPHSMATLQIPR